MFRFSPGLSYKTSLVSSLCICLADASCSLPLSIASGNLQKLSRHPDDLREYFAWMENIRHEYGAVHSYILAKKITASKLVKAHSEPADSTLRAVRHFQASFVPGVDCQILVNDWPYSVPHDATHHVVWSYLPILHPDLVTPDLFQQDIRSQAWSIISRRGLCGTLSSNGALQLPGILDHLVHLPSIALDSISQTNVEDAIRSACSHLVLFIQQHWDLKTHEAVFFANPPSLQSVPSLAHFHVIVKPLSS